MTLIGKLKSWTMFKPRNYEPPAKLVLPSCVLLVLSTSVIIMWPGCFAFLNIWFNLITLRYLWCLLVPIFVKHNFIFLTHTLYFSTALQIFRYSVQIKLSLDHALNWRAYFNVHCPSFFFLPFQNLEGGVVFQFFTLFTQWIY